MSLKLKSVGSVPGARKMGFGFAASLAALLPGATAYAVPPPPPPPAEQAQIDAFFEALPRRLPAPDLEAFKDVVAEDVKVWRNGKLVYDSRERWFAELAENPFADWSMGTPPIAAGIGRDDFYRSPSGAIIVRELVSAVPPPGHQILYHLGGNLRFVTYTLREGILTKVDYGLGFDPMGAPEPYRKP